MSASRLNERQLAVLNWISRGCPEGVWTDFTYKTTAIALQNRHLVVVTRKGGVWRAVLTSAGEHRLQHGDKPQVRNLEAQQQVARVIPEPAELTPKANPPEHVVHAPAPSPAGELMDRVMAAGGRVVIETTRYDGHESRWVDEANHEGLLPEGKRLRSRRRSARQLLVFVTDDPASVVPPRLVRVPARAGRFHPAAAAYKDTPDFHAVSTGSLARATRILHAVAATLTEAGMLVEAPVRQGNLHRAVRSQLKVQRGAFSEWIQMSEKSHPGGDMQHPYYRTGKGRPPLWQERRQTKFIATGHLIMEVGSGYPQDARQCKFRDSKRTQLEDHVSAIVREVEMRMFTHDEDALEQQREKQERERLWEVAVEQARVQALEDFRITTLTRQVDAWHEHSRLREYHTAMVAHVDSITDPQVHANAQHWQSWVHEHLAKLNPLNASVAMPESRQFRRADLEPYLEGWGYGYLTRLK